MLWPIYRTVEYGPLEEMRRLQRQMNRLFEGHGEEMEPYPAVNIFGNEQEVLVTAELPGVDPSSVEITVTGGQLTLKGERKEPAPEKDVICHRSERGFGKFVRMIRLPFEIESEKVTATSKNGVLTVKLSRAKASKPKQINVLSE